ncbi:YdaS family helix-turn-helix protein [Yersinia enterocolitica]|nr:helix-turn-helix domain-containing protein [Yersinia enterocolitica]
MRNKGIEKAIMLVGGTQQKLAKKTKHSQSTISEWLNGKSLISPEFVPGLVAATQGKVKAYEFRPDLPELFPHPE